MKRGQMESDCIWWPLSVVVLVLVDQIETDDSGGKGISKLGGVKAKVNSYRSSRLIGRTIRPTAMK